MFLFAKRRTLLTARLRSPAKPSIEALEAREVPYAVSGNAWPHPEMITIGFVPDGTILDYDTNGSAIPSNLQATFNTKYGSSSAWQNILLKAAQTWAQQTNINFNVITDSGAEAGSGAYQQGDPNIADIRIGGYNFGSTNLGETYMPPPVNNYSIAGDLRFNTGILWNTAGVADLYTVALHEFGHALGLSHSAVSTAALKSNYNGVMNGLSADDISGIRAVTGWSTSEVSSPGYGGTRIQDAYDLAAANGTSTSASIITSTINTASKTALLTNLDITNATDVDFYKFTVPTGLGGSLTIKAQSTGFSLLAPSLFVYNSGMGQLASSAAATSKIGATVSSTVSVTAGQTYYIKMQGATTDVFGMGKYALTLAFAGVTSPTVALPDTTTLNGTVLNGGGGLNASPNRSQMMVMGEEHGDSPWCHISHMEESDHGHTHDSGPSPSGRPDQEANWRTIASLLQRSLNSSNSNPLSEIGPGTARQSSQRVMPQSTGRRNERTSAQADTISSGRRQHSGNNLLPPGTLSALEGHQPGVPPLR